MKICAKLTHRVDFEEQLKILNELGIKYIQFDFEPRIEGFRDNHSFEYFEAAFEIIEKYGLKIEAFHSWMYEDMDTMKRALTFYLNCMVFSDAEYLILHMSKQMEENIKEINDMIKKFDILKKKVCIENSSPPYYMRTLEEVKRIIEKMPLALFCLDTGHALQENIEINDFLNAFKEKIEVIHLNDYDGHFDHLPAFSARLNEKNCSFLKDFEGSVVFEMFCEDSESFRMNYQFALAKIREIRE